MTDLPTGEGAPPSPGDGGAGAVRRAVWVAAVEAAGLLAYAVSIGVLALTGSTEGSAPPVEVAIFVILAAGIALVARGLHSRLHLAYGPFVVTQLFGLVVGGTVVAGGSLLTRVIGVVILLVALLGLALAANRDLREALAD